MRYLGACGPALCRIRFPGLDWPRALGPARLQDEVRNTPRDPAKPHNTWWRKGDTHAELWGGDDAIGHNEVDSRA